LEFGKCRTNSYLSEYIVEIRVRFNTGEIVEDFVVLYKIEFKAPKFKWF